jgi:hypothetical protein
MNESVYKLVYCSTGCIRGTSAEVSSQIHQILDVARKNNEDGAVTGALLYSGAIFAQALEGPLPSVERIFEKIQRDPRHRDVTVLQSGESDHRDFPAWSMALAGSAVEEGYSLPETALETAMANTTAAGERVLSLLRDLVTQQEF